MTTLVELPTHLEQPVAEAAARAGLSVQEYVARVLTADQAAARGSREERIERAGTLAAAAYQQWVTGGCSEAGAMTLDEVFE
ncbi:hypothetical protein [Kitasatospora azatica]|uniref:hypothetical protein n=1 Tax=Kitasatospora azatica TaxID=58347 RepID=UPI00055BD03F|nr:hypothetical protein [Kitasatospora azatica]